MSEDQTTEETTPEGTDESPNVKRMREQIQTLQQEKETLAARVKMSAFKEAGLDPEQGIGKATYRTYDGEVDPNKIAEFAKEEYGWEPQGAGVSDAQKRMTAISQVGSAEEARNSLEQADAAAAEGDWVKSAALKDQELLAITKKRTGYQ